MPKPPSGRSSRGYQRQGPELGPFDGILLVDKPSGPTSHDIVDAVRGAFGLHKVGHCGTLDPLATGLLVLVLGKATRLSQYLIGDDKGYCGHMILGARTDSQDADGEIIDRADPSGVTREAVESAFERFRGDIFQVPPMVSAIKRGGRPLYKLARRGESVDREPRLVHVYELRMIDFATPRVDFEVRCGKGTYVRTLCADIGDVLECGAHLGGLRRTSSGVFSIGQSVSFPELLRFSRTEIQARIIPAAEVALRLQRQRSG